MMAALQADQGLARSIWMRVGDIMWLVFSRPKTSSQALTLSWGMLNTWPGDKGGSMNNPAQHDEQGPPQLLSGETET